jgi:hypothetical protein
MVTKTQRFLFLSLLVLLRGLTAACCSTSGSSSSPRGNTGAAATATKVPPCAHQTRW